MATSRLANRGIRVDRIDYGDGFAGEIEVKLKRRSLKSSHWNPSHAR